MKYQDYILMYSSKYNLKAELVASVINVESGYDKNAKSSSGAIGLMQLMPSTAIWIGEKIGLEIDEEILTDEKINIELGCYYLSYLFDKFEDNNTALASYNAGPATVNKWLLDKEYSEDGVTLKNIPYKETKNYLKKIDKNLKYYSKKY